MRRVVAVTQVHKELVLHPIHQLNQSRINVLNQIRHVLTADVHRQQLIHTVIHLAHRIYVQCIIYGDRYIHVVHTVKHVLQFQFQTLALLAAQFADILKGLVALAEYLCHFLTHRVRGFHDTLELGICRTLVAVEIVVVQRTLTVRRVTSEETEQRLHVTCRRELPHS